MAAKAVNRRMPSSERSYTSAISPVNLCSEKGEPFKAATFRCFRSEIEQEEIDV
jgi:hypothetical protein